MSILNKKRKKSTIKRLLTIVSYMLIAISALAENTKTVDVIFANFPAGSQYADSEEHILSDELAIYTTDCHFTTELRIYSSTTYNGYVVSAPLPGHITQMTFRMGHKKDKLNVYGSADGVNWTLIKDIETTTTSYKNYTLNFPSNSTYTCFKLDVNGDQQIRIESMTITYTTDEEDSEPTEPEKPETPEEPTEPNNGSKSKPYIVTDIWDMPTSTTKEGVWIRGTIYGTIGNNGLTAAGTVSTNIVIGNATTYVPIELPKGEIRDAINLRDHPYLKGKELLIEGNIEKYYNKLGLKSPSTYTVSYNVAVNCYGYASLYLDMPVEVPSGCTAYYCTTEGDQAYLHPVGNIIPDSTGVIISCEPNSSCALTYTTGANEDEEHIHAENQLVGFAKETVVEEDGYAYYALNAKDNQVGFYIPQTATDKTDASTGFTAKAFKAYLQVPKEHKTLMFVIPSEDDETEIAPITHITEEVIYDLQGRVINNPTRGIYIQGERKIIIK